MEKIIDFYRYAITEMEKENVFFGHSAADAVSEAWWLVTGALHLPIDAARHDFLNAHLMPEECELLYDLIHKRTVERIPTAYLLQETYQNGYRFYIDERALIPRSPLAHLIDKQCAPSVTAKKVHRILDLCTGSGCLAILAAYAFPHAIVDAADLSVEALQVAMKNIGLHMLGEQINLIQSDVFHAFTTEKYDIIFSNPPYVNAIDLEDMPPEYHHEPLLALAAGHDGLAVVKQILAGAKRFLNPGGMLIVEVGNSKAALLDTYPHLPFIWPVLESGSNDVFILSVDSL